ncbi:OmpA family protein [Brunnivagina elsteri]|uniref:Flagellar motor protein MotB n=1 Tax=Brunnivagina elsteri CCALA 953 TaxID=987040 RepID=A0A2A2TPQ9_9CYAN|nr:OmpA family protein [Calothrix elsteri]PAX60459.1 flagellar motor protein MotB [Calothrix elsteri CCALA 953]
MSKFSTNGFSKEFSNLDNQEPEESIKDELNELRTLLLGVEPKKLSQVCEYIETQKIKPEDISRILPEAVILRSLQDKQFVEAMIPTIEQAVETSVQRDLNILSNAIFPILGPSTRRAIASALEEMLQSLDKTLEHGFSIQSFKWRLEARQTGKSFAEVVLLRTLIYRVEQVFLIHKKTGLLLQHVVASQVAVQDPDLVSAMLTAIQDFVKDSFSVDNGDRLHTLNFGELTIWIEEGPTAVLAGIIRGNAPHELRLVFQDTIEKIHLRFDNELYNFQGETEPFNISQPYLEDCLKVRYQTPKKTNYRYAYTLIGLIIFGLCIWGSLIIREQKQWNNFIQRLSSQPGITITKVQKENGKYLITGMRDPLAVDVDKIREEHNINPEKIKSKFEPYLSLQPEFITKRAEALLQPPKTVLLKVESDGILYATGSAPEKWISETRKMWHFIPGITQFQEKNLSNIDVSQIERFQQEIEREKLLFQEGKNDLIASEVSKLEKIFAKLQKMVIMAKSLNQNVKIKIIGHTSATGTEQYNLQLSQARAEQIKSYFISKGLSEENFYTQGLGSNQPLTSSTIKQDIDTNRRVGFKVDRINK